MVTSSIPALPRFFFTFSQARSKFFRLNTLSISEWTFFLPCLCLDVREVRCAAVSSVLVLGLSRKELSNCPGPTRCVAAFLTYSPARGLSPPPGLLGQAAPLHTAAVRGFV